MSVGVFTDKHARPTDAAVASALGDRRPAWDELIAYIRGHYAVEEDFRFLYGKRYGWALRFRVRGQLLTSLYPTAGGFTVQINLSPAAVEQAQALPLGESARQAIARATPYPEGRWLFIPIAVDGDLADIRHLLALRAADKRLAV